jgi:hypothetical protein
MKAALALHVRHPELGHRHFLARVVRHLQVIGTRHHRWQVIIRLEWCLEWPAHHCEWWMKMLESCFVTANNKRNQQDCQLWSP